MTSLVYLPGSSGWQQGTALPESLREPLLEAWEAYTEACTDAGVAVPRHPDFTASMLRVWACSEFVCQQCIGNPLLVQDMLADGSLLSDYPAGEYQRRLQAALHRSADPLELGRRLRAFRNREMLRIAWRDLAGWAPLDEVLRDLSGLADASIACALERLMQHAVVRLGRAGKTLSPSLVVLAMGKLGAGELNFSSDIDLIFAYPEPGRAWNRSPVSADEFYTRLGRDLIRVLDHKDEHGFVFRVDMRLRPYGNSGPLVASFDALADYYQSHGREWERYAMIKARPVTGSDSEAGSLMELLQPFVYRRYLDFGVFDSLRDLKVQIMREVERKGMQENIKLGPGGIREIEFIAQAFQLVRGGRQPELRKRAVLTVLDRLAGLGHLPALAALQLSEAYVFLRRTENRLQAFEDCQIHELPADDLQRCRLAYAMGFQDWGSFVAELERHRDVVQTQFEQVFADPADRRGGAETGRAGQLGEVWRDSVDGDGARDILRSAGYPQPGEALAWLSEFRKGPVTRYLGERGKQRLDELVPMLLQEVTGGDEPLEVLKNVGRILEAVSGRTTYLSLLVENPLARSELIQLCAASPWLAEEIAQHPILLDELLDPRTLYDPLDKPGLQGVLDVQLAGVPAGDLELQMDALRQFRQAAVLHVAATDIIAGLPLPAVGDRLTAVAEVVLERVARLAWDHMVSRYGKPGFIQHGKLRIAQFAIAGYGKLGGYEMGYGSDLDIVFLHDSRAAEQHTAGPQVIDNSEFFTRLSQRIIHLLNTYTSAGILYEVDMRLRPNGNSGLLVTSMEAFAEYQRRSAWTWENQALIRARIVTGGADIQRQFDRIRSGVLARPRDEARLKNEVREMRQRMRDELDRPGPSAADLKHSPGGIVDIEFMVQCGVLLWSSGHHGLLRYTDNLNLLQALAAAGLFPAEHAEVLSGAYLALRQCLNHRVLQGLSATVDMQVLAAERAGVRRIWDSFIGAG